MADAVLNFPLQLPAGNGSTAIYYVAANLGWSDVSEIMLVFPAGCASLVGVRIEFAVNPVYPQGNSNWFILDDYILRIPVSHQGQSGQWRVVGYNADRYQHTVQSYFFFDYLTAAEQQASSSLVGL